MVISYLPVDNENHVIYDINFYSDTISTLVTDSPAMVDRWISETNPDHYDSFVGLDVEWRPSFNRNIYNPVATLQLCVSHRCLIYQIMRSVYMPDSLEQFLGDRHHLFVGVGIDSDVEKLRRDYGLSVACTADLRTEAAERTGMWQLRNAGLSQLTGEMLGKDLYKPRAITLSRWDNQELTPEQVKYACLDAFLSWQIGYNIIPGWECCSSNKSLLLVIAVGSVLLLLSVSNSIADDPQEKMGDGGHIGRKLIHRRHFCSGACGGTSNRAGQWDQPLMVGHGSEGGRRLPPKPKP